MIHSDSVPLTTKGFSDIIDITDKDTSLDFDDRGGKRNMVVQVIGE